MPIRLDKIPLVLVRKIERNSPIVETTYNNGYVKGFNQAINQQGQVQIRSNRERLIKLILKKAADIPKPIPGECILTHWKCSVGDLADEIEQNLGYILEFCPPEKAKYHALQSESNKRDMGRVDNNF